MSDGGEELSVGDFGGAGREVVDAGLEGEGLAEGVAAVCDVPGGKGDLLGGLEGRHEEAAGVGAVAAGDVEDVEVLAGPGGSELLRPVAELGDVELVVADGAGKGLAYAVGEGALGQRAEGLQLAGVAAGEIAGRGALGP